MAQPEKGPEFDSRLCALTFIYIGYILMNTNETRKKNRKCLAAKKIQKKFASSWQIMQQAQKNSDSLSEKFVRSATCWCSKSSKKIPSESPKNEILSGRVTFVDSEVKVNSWRYLELERKSVFAFV